MQNLEHSLKLNMTVPVYLFWGEEDLLMEEYIRKVSHVVAPDGESWSVETYHGDEASPDEILFALARMSRFKPLNLLMQVCISILRGTPLMLQLIVVFFMPYYVFGIKLTTSWRVYAALIGFSVNYAAYFGEIFRAGIQAVPVGQHEAAEVLGFTKAQTFWKIVFPQMVKRVVPPVTNEVITLVKDTSMAFAIAYAEMFTMAKQVAAAQSNIMPLFVAGVFYYVFNIVVAWIMGKVEKSLDYFQ